MKKLIKCLLLIVVGAITAIVLAWMFYVFETFIILGQILKVFVATLVGAFLYYTWEDKQ